MIYIDFKIDEKVLAEDLDEDITKYDESVFIVSMFIMPVRMQINGTDFFEYRNVPWSQAPLLNLASNGLKGVKELKNNNEVSYHIYEGPGDFKFSLVEENTVHIDFNNWSKHLITTVKYHELLEAFQSFAEKVRIFLRERVPQINEHPYWGPWLRGERD